MAPIVCVCEHVRKHQHLFHGTYCCSSRSRWPRYVKEKTTYSTLAFQIVVRIAPMKQTVPITAATLFISSLMRLERWLAFEGAWIHVSNLYVYAVVVAVVVVVVVFTQAKTFAPLSNTSVNCSILLGLVSETLVTG